MLVHICCSVDSFYYIKRIKQDFPHEKILGYFYDPNIHPKAEYNLRCLEARRSCEILGVDFLEGPYDDDAWFGSTKGLEAAPENSCRCEVCFDVRLFASAQAAAQLGHKTFTTTLLMSPKKDFKKLENSAAKAKELSGVDFIFLDYRKNGGTQEQFALAKEMQTYKQNYCGCNFALSKQRQKQDRPLDELSCNIHKKTLPADTNERLELFKARRELEARGMACKILKERFLNYRLLWGRVSTGGVVVRSYFLWYSLPVQKKFSALPTDGEKVFFFTPQALGLESLQDLWRASIDEEIAFRRRLGFGDFDLSVIVILEEIKDAKYTVELSAKTYEDLRLRLVKT